MFKQSRLLSIVISIILLSVASFAWGPSAMYHDQRPLILAPGESADVFMILQNMIGNENITINAAIVEGQDIAVITDTTPIYPVNFGVSDVKVNIKITIPKDAELGTDYSVTLFFTPVQVSDQGGLVQLVGAIKKTIPVQVREPVVLPIENTQEQKAGNINISKDKDINYPLIILFGLIILIILTLLLANCMHTKKQKNISETKQTLTTANPVLETQNTQQTKQENVNVPDKQTKK